MDQRTREQVAGAAAEQLLAARNLPPAVVGFDGFIDVIIDSVEMRRDMTPTGYARFRTISAFASRCAAAAGKSTNIERVIRERRFGGNGPLMASAMSRLGMPVTYIGAVGEPENGGWRIHPVFRGFAGRCARVIAVGEPSETQCLEFDDGKIMLNETGVVQAVTWERIVETVGMEALRTLFEPAAAVGVVNWSLLGGVPGIWRGLMRDILPALSRRPRRVFIDLSDPAKRTDSDVSGGMALLGELERAGFLVCLGVNLSEATRIEAVLGGGALAGAGEDADGSIVMRGAASIRERMGIDVVQVHLRHGAGAADRAGAAWFDGPFTRTPRLSTGAGDHCNGGFAVGRTLGMPLAESLALGCATSGAYVRDAESPDRARVAAFLRALPPPERV
jgi:sugar/nucleoside kinase (ribokinase family)